MPVDVATWIRSSNAYRILHVSLLATTAFYLPINRDGVARTVSVSLWPTVWNRIFEQVSRNKALIAPTYESRLRQPVPETGFLADSRSY